MSGAPIIIVQYPIYNNIVVNKLGGSNSSVYTRPAVFVSIMHVHSDLGILLDFSYYFNIQ